MLQNIYLSLSFCADILSQCNAALTALRRSKAGVAENRSDKMQKELSQAFKRKSGAATNTIGKRSKRTAWKHTFVCLAFYSQRKIPTTASDKDELFEAGLGRKEIEFTSLDLEPKDFRELIY